MHCIDTIFTEKKELEGIEEEEAELEARELQRKTSQLSLRERLLRI